MYGTVNLRCVDPISDVGHVWQRACFFAPIIDVIDFGIGVDQVWLHHFYVMFLFAQGKKKIKGKRQPKNEVPCTCWCTLLAQ
jgi:hypothetical protein